MKFLKRKSSKTLKEKLRKIAPRSGSEFGLGLALELGLGGNFSRTLLRNVLIKNCTQIFVKLTNCFS